MKRILLFLLVIISILSYTGCAQKAERTAWGSTVSSIVSDKPAVTESTPTTAPTASPAPTPTPEPKKFNFTADDFYKAMTIKGIYEDITVVNEFSSTYDYGGYIAESTVGKILDNRRFMCFTDPVTDELFAISIIYDYVPDYNEDFDFGDNVNSAVQLCDPSLTAKGVFSSLNTAEVNIGQTSTYEAGGLSFLFGRTREGEYNGEYMVISLTGSAVDPKTLPHKIDKAPDFLSEYSDEIADYYQSCDYKGLLELVDSYIDTQLPKETDSAYIIKDLVTPVTGYQSKCKVKHDKLEDDYFVYYKGVESISKSTNFVPYLENGDLEFVIGFKASNWLFFDDYDIYVDKDDYIYGPLSDKQENVLSNGNVEEYTKDEFEYEDIQRILDSQEPVIRFDSSHYDKHKDHELTKAEKTALKTLYELSVVNDKLWSLVKCWKFS